MQKLGKLTTCAVVLLSATIPDKTNAVNLKNSQHQQSHALAHTQSKSFTGVSKFRKENVLGKSAQSQSEGSEEG